AAGCTASRPRCTPRARSAGVRAPCRGGGLRGDVHLAHRGRVGPRDREARRGARRGAGRDARDLAGLGYGASPHAGRGGLRRVRANAARHVIVRWGVAAVAVLLGELAIERPLLVTSARFAEVELPVEQRFAGVRRHAPVDTVDAAIEAAAGADGLVGLGGGSAIDTAKAASAATGVALIAVPTTYSGSEWTTYFGMRDEARRAKTGGGGAR